LTGSQRSNLDYLLENLLDPSALVGRNYQMSVLQTKDGRLLTGIVLAETGAALTLRTPTEEVVVPVDEIVLRERTNISVMPEDLLERLTEVEACDLIAYLAGAEQAPLPDGAGK
jgi:putative heme-binding domain-containing protein